MANDDEVLVASLRVAVDHCLARAMARYGLPAEWRARLTIACDLRGRAAGKVEVVDAQTFKSEATIAGFTSPRYLLPVGNGKAYVSDLYGNALSVVDLTTHQRVGSIPCQGWTEEMVLADGRVFVTNRSNAFLLVVDPQTDAIADTVVVGHGANSIRQDGAGKVWVLCSGNGANAAALYRINPGSLVVEAVFPFPAGAGPGRRQHQFHQVRHVDQGERDFLVAGNRVHAESSNRLEHFQAVVIPRTEYDSRPQDGDR